MQLKTLFDYSKLKEGTSLNFRTGLSSSLSMKKKLQKADESLSDAECVCVCVCVCVWVGVAYS